jgi:hypothetical protein
VRLARAHRPRLNAATAASGTTGQSCQLPPPEGWKGGGFHPSRHIHVPSSPNHTRHGAVNCAGVDAGKVEASTLSPGCDQTACTPGKARRH